MNAHNLLRVFVQTDKRLYLCVGGGGGEGGLSVGEKWLRNTVKKRLRLLLFSSTSKGRNCGSTRFCQL